MGCARRCGGEGCLGYNGPTDAMWRLRYGGNEGCGGRERREGCDVEEMKEMRAVKNAM